MTFGHLVDLAGIEQELSGSLLPLTPDVESAAKTKPVGKIIENRNEDGYSIFADYHADRNRHKGEISRLENDACSRPLVARYPLDEMPVWVFLELSPFGTFAEFYLFCADRWRGDAPMKDKHYLLRRINSLRDAAAHSSAMINGLGVGSNPPFRQNHGNGRLRARQARCASPAQTRKASQPPYPTDDILGIRLSPFRSSAEARDDLHMA